MLILFTDIWETGDLTISPDSHSPFIEYIQFLSLLFKVQDHIFMYSLSTFTSVKKKSVNVIGEMCLWLKSTCYTYRGPGFVSQYPHIISLTSFIIYVPENPLPSGLLQDQTPIWCTCISGDAIDLKHLLCSKRLELLLDHRQN